MAASPAGAQRYTVTDLGILPGRANTILFGIHVINEAGDIAGYCNNGGQGSNAFFGDYFSESLPFVWSKQGGLQQLPLLPGTANTIGWTLNDRGQVAGSAGDSWAGMRGVVWEKGTVRALEPLPGDNGSGINGMNNRGDVVGTSLLSPDGSANFVHTYALLWHRGAPSLLTNFGRGSTAVAINDRGQICGALFTADPGDMFHSVPVVWDRGTVIFLSPLGGDWCLPEAINRRGEVAGVGQNSLGMTHGCIWKNGVLSEIGDLGGGLSELWDINDRGQTVGDSLDAVGDGHAILVENGAITDLNDQIPSNSGWVLWWAVGINERGQIAGTGLHNGEIRSYLLTPR
jgi:probable HAF family extracellular repeat protein